jgi:hypothetical protein
MAAVSIVRSSVRRLLESSPGFRALPAEKQRRIASDTVRVAAYMADPDGLVSREFRAPLLRPRRVRSSGALTVRLGHTLHGGSAALDGLAMNGVDFPAFVAALIHGVFNAIVSASIQQTEAYAALIADVAESLDEFMADNITDQAARDTLVQEYPELFCPPKASKAGLAWRPDAGRGAGLRLQAALGLPKLEPDLRRVVAATRRRLARNRQQTLATMVLMGINRIVVTNGRIVPKIRFELSRG